MELITSEQRDELITTFVERDAFHLELKDAYATAIEDGPFSLLPGDIVFPVQGHDWWLFDDRLVAVGHFHDDGRVQGHEIITDHAVVTECARIRDQLWAIALPHSNYEPV